jgi:ribosomal protein L9
VVGAGPDVDPDAVAGPEQRVVALADAVGALTAVAVQVGEEDKLYGSVTTLDIARKLKEQGHDVERREIALAEPIRQTGVYDVEVRLHREVSVPIKVSVVKE